MATIQALQKVGTRVTNCAQADQASWEAIVAKLPKQGLFERFQNPSKSNPRLYHCVFSLSSDEPKSLAASPLAMSITGGPSPLHPRSHMRLNEQSVGGSSVVCGQPLSTPSAAQQMRQH